MQFYFFTLSQSQKNAAKKAFPYRGKTNLWKFKNYNCASHMLSLRTVKTSSFVRTLYPPVLISVLSTIPSSIS